MSGGYTIRGGIPEREGLVNFSISMEGVDTKDPKVEPEGGGDQE